MEKQLRTKYMLQVCEDRSRDKPIDLASSTRPTSDERQSGLFIRLNQSQSYYCVAKFRFLPRRIQALKSENMQLILKLEDSELQHTSSLQTMPIYLAINDGSPQADRSAQIVHRAAEGTRHKPQERFFFSALERLTDCFQLPLSPALLSVRSLV
jgi:hypothetical protein